ncbi:hypothetical protein bas09_0078 [Changchunvirus paulsarasin]|uniref:Uncharacterized protein n=1 Tax=Escherichia phage PaulSarasin TaxID=2851973 RepID=A0AAE7VY07_9CAUD|nr:hypothetical protein bas09_0078 [Escherichia phage PaulSarasin]
MHAQPPFDFHKAMIIGLTILTVMYGIRGVLWFAMH